MLSWTAMYDHVVLRAAPLLLVSDALPLAGWADATVLVSKYKVTRLSEISKVQRILAQTNARVAGLLVNDVPSSLGVYDSYEAYEKGSMCRHAVKRRTAPPDRAFWRVAATFLITCSQSMPFSMRRAPLLPLRPARTDPASATPLTIDSGDVINVQIFNTPELSANHRVGSDGEITLPGAGAVKVAGFTPLQAGSAIEKLLRDTQIMLDPHVTVTVTEYTTEGITVLGEVRNPGTYPLLGTQSLNSALAAAGGVTPLRDQPSRLRTRPTPDIQRPFA